MLRRSGIIFLCIFCLISVGAIVHLYIRRLPPLSLDSFTISGTTTTPNNTKPCLDVDWLQNLTIKSPLKYARRDIIVSPKPGLKRASVTKIDAPLFPEPQLINLTENPVAVLQHCEPPLALDVPAFDHAPVDATHLFFGMTTTLDRLEESVVFLERWLAHTQAKLFVVAAGPGNDVQAADPQRMKEVEARLRTLGLDITIVNALDPQDHFPQRYFSLVRVMYSNRGSSTRWMILIDDDTFFPSMHSLVAVLDSHNAQEQFYIGALSEDWWSVTRYGLMGFGGAGIFLSVALASVLDAHYQDCKDSSGSSSGDVRIMECVYRHTNTKLTHIPGLYQMDITGDRSGLFESGRLPLSLHHWKGGWWDEDGYGSGFPMAKMHLVNDMCGECFMQRWQFGPSMILSNGYSVATYPKRHLADGLIDLDKAETTYSFRAVDDASVNRGTDHYVGPGRDMLVLEEEKIQYRFLDAVKVPGVGIRQFYIHLGIGDDLDTLFEIFWKSADG